MHRGDKLQRALDLDKSDQVGLNSSEWKYLNECSRQETEERWLRKLPRALAIAALAAIVALQSLRLLARGDVTNPLGGPITMGSIGGDAQPAEAPAWVTTVAPFRLERYEVTNRQYWICVLAVVCDRPKELSGYSDAGRSAHPVVSVTASQADTFCRWIGRRLPTEVEWEWAARGGGALRRWPWGPNAPDTQRVNVQFGPDEATTLQPAASYPDGATPDTHIFNLAGNAMEWTATPYQSYPYNPDSAQARWDGDPVAAPAGLVVRGGSFKNDLRFTSYHTRPGGTRQDVLAVLWGQEPVFRLNAEALAWLADTSLPAPIRKRLVVVLPWDTELAADALGRHLTAGGVTLNRQQQQQVGDALAVAAYHAQTRVPILGWLLSDDAAVYD